MRRYFFDTNVLVYAFDDRDPRKREIAHTFIRDAIDQFQPIVSTQVLQEFFWSTTRRLKTPLPVAEAQHALISFTRFELVQVDLALIYEAIVRVEDMSISFWDALIVSAALRAKADALITEDLQDGQVIGGMRIENPFRVI
jgi:predicted nucleic acid-binding protein